MGRCCVRWGAYFHLKIRPSPMQPPAQGHRGRGRECNAVAMLAGGRQPAQHKDTEAGAVSATQWQCWQVAGSLPSRTLCAGPTPKTHERDLCIHPSALRSLPRLSL